MIKREDDGLWIVLEETVSCHHDETFSCLTTPSGLTRWFPVTAEIEARPGGKLVLGWDPQLERKTTIAVLDHDPGGTMVWDWYAGHEDRHAPVYWEVRPSVEDGSIISLRQGPFGHDEDSLVAMANEAASWSWRLCNLRSVLESKHDMRKVRPL